MDVLTRLHRHRWSRSSRSLSIRVSDGREEKGGGEEGGEDELQGLVMLEPKISQPKNHRSLWSEELCWGNGRRLDLLGGSSSSL